jgi:ribonuclease HIII
VLTLMPEQYNLLYSQFKNLNPMLAGLHTEIIQTLVLRHSCPVAIVDQFADSSLIAKNFKPENIKLYHTTKGEKYTAVAAASILARDAFLNGLKALSETYSIDLPKGSGEHAARAMEKIKAKKLIEKIPMMAKTHFGNVKAGM